MSTDWLRTLTWAAGAFAFTCFYGVALAASPVYLPEDVGHDLLLLTSGLAACMVGGTGAGLVYDWAHRKG